LPALPDGKTVGALPVPMPAATHQRFVTLYQTLGEAWRVTGATSLFDYAPGTSTATFTDKSWPPETLACTVPNGKPAQPLKLSIAQDVCGKITSATSKADCIFDVTTTGDTGFAQLYLASQRAETSGTTTTVNDSRNPSPVGAPVTFVASVSLTASGTAVTSGTIQFTLDGANAGAPVKLNAKGQATWQTSTLAIGNHQVAAIYTAAAGSVYLASRSLDSSHATRN
jgi:hypothetical protein